MPKYDYNCDVCGHEYIEVRDESESLFKENCVVTGCSGTHTLVE
jgi:predicted nucleic acid-binding Zn ribbon protein